MRCSSDATSTNDLKPKVIETPTISQLSMPTRNVDSNGNCWVKSSNSRHCTRPIPCSNDDKSDREAIELVWCCAHSGACNVEYDKAKHASVEDLNCTCLHPSETLSWC